MLNEETNYRRVVRVKPQWMKGQEQPESLPNQQRTKLVKCETETNNLYNNYSRRRSSAKQEDLEAYDFFGKVCR